MNKIVLAAILATLLLAVSAGCTRNDGQKNSPDNNPVDYSELIRGRFVLSYADCAGFDFITPTLVSWTNDMNCFYADTLKMQWLSPTLFYTQDMVQKNANCPPRVNIYEVMFFDGDSLALKEFWTGWDYTIEKSEEDRESLLEFVRGENEE